MKYMFVVAHPDDEVLGAGGLINKLVREGNEIDVVIMNALYERTRENMKEDILVSHKILGIKKRKLLPYKNMEFHNSNQRKMVEDIEAEIDEFQPDYIFTHFDNDIHNDHRIVSILTQQASRKWQRHNEGHKIKGLYFMEGLSSTNWSAYPFKCDTYIEISEEDLEQKIKALACYKNVIREVPHPRSVECIKALATLRGGDIGFRYAEGFKTCWRDNI